MDSLKKIKAEKIHLTLTLGEVDALIASGRAVFEHWGGYANDETQDLVAALQKLDEAVNL